MQITEHLMSSGKSWLDDSRPLGTILLLLNRSAWGGAWSGGWNHANYLEWRRQIKNYEGNKELKARAGETAYLLMNLWCDVLPSAGEIGLTQEVPIIVVYVKAQ